MAITAQTVPSMEQGIIKMEIPYVPFTTGTDIHAVRMVLVDELRAKGIPAQMGIGPKFKITVTHGILSWNTDNMGTSTVTWSNK
jgi:hypothetical protein